MTARRFPDIPPVWLLGFMLAAGIFGSLVPILSFEIGIVERLGRIVMALGVLLIVWSGYWFYRKKTPIEPHDTPKNLIIEGPYRLNRNPIYSGMTLILFGFALDVGSVLALAIAALFPVLITSHFIRHEEAALTEAFGEEAARYFAATGRWL